MRIGAAIVVMLGLVLAGGVQASELRKATDRPYLTEIGDPILISRELLQRELDRNSEMAEFVAKYGWPDYAEVQEVAVQEPLAPYEVRLYYLRRNQEVAYARAYVSPALQDFGVRTYAGPIPEETLERILTATGEVAAPSEPLPEEPVEGAAAEGRAAPEEGIMAALLRLEAAADRAALAAEMAERASQSANASATRANAVLDKMLAP